MMDKDIRWKQRFKNFSNAFSWLAKTVNRTDLDFMQQAGAIQFFEICSELSWNLMKDYLEEQGYNDVASPRAAIKQAFKSELINDGQAWLQLLNDRNLTSHVYNEETANKVYRLISDKYYILFSDLYNTFSQLENA